MNVIKLTSMEEVQSVYDWKELHKKEVRRGIIPVDEVKILVEIEPEPFTVKVSKNGDELVFRLFNEGRRFAKFTIKLVPGGYIVEDENIELEGLDDDSATRLLQDFVTLYLTLMALLVESPKQEAEEPNKAPEMKLQKVRNGKKGKKKQGYCYIVTKSRAKAHEGGEKRHYAKCEESFQVRGHFRHYKSGKTIWIESFTKGSGKPEKIGRTYKLGDLKNLK